MTSHPRRLLALLAGALIALAAIVVGPTTPAFAGTTLVPCSTMVGMGTANHDWRAAIASCARQNVGVTEWGNNCNAYTGALYGNSCQSTGGWCADFLKWVWLNALRAHSDFVDAAHLTSLASSVKTWAQMSGHYTWKTSNPMVGDAVVFGGTGHTGIVVGVSGSTITMIGGNVQNQVHQDTLTGTVGTYWGGMPLLGYASPDASWSNPFGHVDSVAGGTGSVSMHGWTIDGDTAAAIPVDVYVDNHMIGRYTANASRPDVGNVYPAYGPNHGYWISFPMGAGSHNVCVFAINYHGTGTTNPLLGCVATTVH